MEVFTLGFKALYDILNIDYDLFGYTINMWQLFLFSIIGSMVIAFIFSLFD